MNHLTTYSVYSLEFLEFNKQAALANFRFALDKKWECEKFDESEFKKLGKTITYSVNSSKTRHWVILNEFAVMLIEITAKNILFVRILAENNDAAELVATSLQLIVREVPEPSIGRVRVRFWNDSSHGPVSNSRTISVPAWENVENNYSLKSRGLLDELINKFRPTKGGSLIIWHGPPGTGKTYALRALLNQWKDWCTAEYILDPETLFGHDPSYFTSLLFGDSTNDFYEEDEDDVSRAPEKWKLLILEDTGEMISEDAKANTGPALARLLNLADGFIGQGLRVLILITTNEELERLHPAVARQGRCAAAIHFDNLDVATAKAWASNHNLDPDLVSTNTSLADMFGMVDTKKISNVPEKLRVGFVMH